MTDQLIQAEIDRLNRARATALGRCRQDIKAGRRAAREDIVRANRYNRVARTLGRELALRALVRAV